MTASASSPAYWPHRYAILFYGLLLTLVAAPVIGALAGSTALIEALLAVNLLAAALPFESGLRRRLFLGAVILTAAARPATAMYATIQLSVLTMGMWTLIGLVAAAAALRFALRATAVTSEHIYAALSAYLLAGLFFGMAYWTVDQIHPGSIGASGELTRTGAIYFSFVTLATLGYGDIVPVGDIARGLPIVEGIGGQLFLAVMVARLVSVYAGKR
jgi:hypothetical protein